MTAVRVLALVAVLTACNGSAPVEESIPSTAVLHDSTSDVISSGLPPGNTRLAEIGENWFNFSTNGADLLVSRFDCDSIRATFGEKLVLCGAGGTADAPFITAVVEEYVEAKDDVISTSLTFLLYEPVVDTAGTVTRANVIASDTRSYEATSLDAIEFHLLSAPTAQGDALALHAQIFGGSRTWNEIAMIGLNQFGSTQVVATFDGEGVAIFKDGHGFVVSNYHYAHDDAMCCASYWAANYFRPGSTGWTHTKQTIESDPDKDLDEERLFMGFEEPLQIGILEVPRPEFEQ